MNVSLHLSPDVVETIAQRAAELLARRAPEGSPWMGAEQAAAYLCAPLSRIRKLTMSGELPHAKDGRRVLYRREELDEFIRDGGAKTY